VGGLRVASGVLEKAVAAQNFEEFFVCVVFYASLAGVTVFRTFGAAIV